MKVFINGQSYDDWSQLPDELKQQLAATLPDADHDGVPDVFQGVVPQVPPGQQSLVSTSIEVNGQHYGSIDQLPPEIRETLQSVFGTGFGGAQPAPGTTIPGAQWPAPPAGTTPAAAPPPAAPQPVAPGPAPGVPAQNQVILNGQPVVVEPGQPKKGLFKRLFGR